MSTFNFKKQFGQNFIKDRGAVAKLVRSLDIKPDDLVIEVGPGDGRVTQEILNAGPGKLCSIEIDTELIGQLKAKFADFPNFEVKNQNILDLDIETLTQGKPYKVIGSLPYNISKQIIKKFIEADLKPQAMSFIIQKEVADDYAAKAPKGSFLASFATIFYDVKYIGTVKKNDFVPRPKVDGGMINLIKKSESAISEEYYTDFNKFLFNAFRQPRKKLSNVLKSIYKETDWKAIFQDANINPNARAAELRLEDFIAMYKCHAQTND